MSRVIRGPGAPARVVPAEIVDARAEAERIVAAARAEAEGLVSAARAEAERIRDEAHALGTARGRAEIAALLVDAARARDAALESAARDAQTLALAASARIIGESLALEPERIVAIVRDALARTRRARSLEVRVHPDDTRALEGALESLPGLRIVPDAAITRGGCIARSELGTIDARVEVRLDAMAKLLGCERP